MKPFIGLMSGTSMDGIDAAIVDVTTHHCVAGITRPYDAAVAARLSDLVTHQQTTPAFLSQLNTLIGREFAKAVQQLLAKANMAPQEIAAIGSHGQTICHDACADIPYTMQLGCAHTIAYETGLPVVADFRARDLVVGGQGAPFAPVYHHALFANLESPIAVVNIGGIANVTYLLPDGQVFGYDVGPGNCLLDAWVEQHLHQPYDVSGRWALSGQVNDALLKHLLNDPFLQMMPPKSIGKEYFSIKNFEKHFESIAPQDVQATLLALTSRAITNDIRRNGRVCVKRVLICGGGVHNEGLMQLMADQLPGIPVDSTSKVGVDPDYIEAMMFAWLAKQRLDQTLIDLTTITGSKHPVLLGAIY